MMRARKKPKRPKRRPKRPKIKPQKMQRRMLKPRRRRLKKQQKRKKPLRQKKVRPLPLPRLLLQLKSQRNLQLNDSWTLECDIFSHQLTYFFEININ